jgi:amidophosphoribosyltransferase
MSDELKHHCGVFGIWNDREAAYKTYLGLYALQHRGEESAGIVSTDHERMYTHKEMGYVQEVFDETSLARLKGTGALGHVRYSTSGSSLVRNAQPIVVDYSKGEIAVAHNGNLTNADFLRSKLEAFGAIFQTTTDSEIIVHLMAKPSLRNVKEGIVDALNRVEGAYSLVFMTLDYLIAARDPFGWRPLWIGKTNQGSYVIASETCALDMIDAEPVREVEPGEIVFISDKNKLESLHVDKKPPRTAFCIFEHVYFSRPDSAIFGENVHLVRKKLGRQMALEHPVDADIVIAVPDSGNSAALGFSEASGIPFDVGIIRNHYVGRTFIQPAQNMRDFKVRLKFNQMRHVLEGKRVIVVDDSIVRGTTSRIRIRKLKEAGAKEVHLRISCPPHLFPCAYGIDFPDQTELIAHNKKVDEIRSYLGCDTLGYLSMEGMLKSVKFPKKNYCTACWDGNYPEPFSKVDKFFAEKMSP